MSRVGKLPITIPTNTTITVTDHMCTVKGLKGELTLTIPRGVKVKVGDGIVNVERASDEKKVKALHGTIRNKLFNLVQGVNDGFTKNLVLVGTGYRAKLTGKDLEFSLGFSHPVIVKAVDGIEFTVTDQDKVAVKGFDKELVGQVAANIRALRPPEPYKGKGIRYVDEVILKKAGKTSKSD